MKEHQSLTELAAQHEQARAELTRLTNAVPNARTEVAFIDARIGTGEGLDNPALFSQRRDLIDLVAWLEGQIPAARQAVARAADAENEVVSMLAGARRELDELLSQDRSEADALLAAARRSGDSRAIAFIDAREDRLRARIQTLLDTIRDLSEPAVQVA